MGRARVIVTRHTGPAGDLKDLNVMSTRRFLLAAAPTIGLAPSTVKPRLLRFFGNGVQDQA